MNITQFEETKIFRDISYQNPHPILFCTLKSFVCPYYFAFLVLSSSYLLRIVTQLLALHTTYNIFFVSVRLINRMLV